MNATAVSLVKAGSSPAAAWTLAIGASVVAWRMTGLLAAAPAGAGLGLLAVSDAATHTLSLRTLGVTSGLVALALTAEAARSAEWGRLAVAAVATATVAVVLLVIWISTAGIALGDILLLAFVLAVPLYVSFRAAAITVVVALVAAAAFVAVRAVCRGPVRAATVAMAPALLAGWLVALTVAS